ncbi:(Fe-S)-binding protein [Rhabdochromatium marinum]|uniref:(Fe-S)-binding protein n=1 Tax=Rhabdochromatium marinum TaxID=48729 RepID=UPI0019075183|nr:(Fe-S)-binding protein [Rhabdochromatium marinum]MBK1648890.1 oxidoreductase [Rhabdochromatium marinum]
MPESPPSVIFFGTCLINSLAPQAGLAAMRLLKLAGAQVRFPRAQSCCGQPAYNAGFDAQARQVARAQLDALAGTEPVVVPSASCAGMFRHQYPLLFAGHPEQARAEQLAGRVVDFCAYLQRVLAPAWTDHGPPVTVALHHSCAARRELGVTQEAHALLEALAGVTVIEPERAHECCGFGGTFALKQPEISAAMTADKAEALRATGAVVVLSQDLGCLTSLDGYWRRQQAGRQFEVQTGLQVQHIAEFLWQRVASAAVQDGLPPRDTLGAPQ